MNHKNTIGLNDFAVTLSDGTCIEENITQERAFYIFANNEDCIIQVWSYNEKEDVMCWNNIE